MSSRIEEEQQTVRQMIRLYCRRKEKNKSLCAACRELEEYCKRLSHCPFGEEKPTAASAPCIATNRR